jgi:hypothetical protein
VANTFEIGNDDKGLENKIIDSSWFVLSWKKDPTIDAMLRTLEDISNKFRNVPDLWGKLSAENCLISFYHVELKNIGLTDDLYIKMNARGRLLSPFENFKASLQKYINDNKLEQGIGFTNTFACQIDTTWTDLFWSHRKDNSIDEAFMRFASTIAMIRYSLDKSENRLSTIAMLQENPNSLRPEFFSSTALTYLKDCFNIYTKLLASQIDLRLTFNLWQHKPIESIFSAIVYEDNDYKRIALLTHKRYYFLHKRNI